MKPSERKEEREKFLEREGEKERMKLRLWRKKEMKCECYKEEKRKIMKKKHEMSVIAMERDRKRKRVCIRTEIVERTEERLEKVP